MVIPLSMASGVVLGIGKGNPSFNYSAPHGAGRLFGRKEMKRRLKEGAITMGSFKKSMEGVFSTSLSSENIDESPMAYRRWEDIMMRSRRPSRLLPFSSRSTTEVPRMKRRTPFRCPPRNSGSPNGIRTRVTGLRNLGPRPLDDGPFRLFGWGQGLEPRLLDPESSVLPIRRSPRIAPLARRI